MDAPNNALDEMPLPEVTVAEMRLRRSKGVVGASASGCSVLEIEKVPRSFARALSFGNETLSLTFPQQHLLSEVGTIAEMFFLAV